MSEEKQQNYMHDTLSDITEISAIPSIAKSLSKYRENVRVFLNFINERLNAGVIHGHPLFLFGTINDIQKEFEDLLFLQKYLNSVIMYEEDRLIKK